MCVQVGRAYDALGKMQQAPRGFAFWDIFDEGAVSPQRPKEPVWLAAGLNRFMNIRTTQVTENSEKTVASSVDVATKSDAK